MLPGGHVTKLCQGSVTVIWYCINSFTFQYSVTHRSHLASNSSLLLFRK